MRVVPATLTDPRFVALLRLHLEGMHTHSPPGHVFALGEAGLASADVTVFAVEDGPALIGMGALKALSATHGEIKSMRTHPDHLKRGVGRLVLDKLIASARERGFSRLSLETGSGPAFDAAIALYQSAGFRNGGPFSDYEPSAFNQFLHLDLNHAG